MPGDKKFSLLFPRGTKVDYKRLETSTFHDLGLDLICKEVTSEPKEQTVIAEILANFTADPAVTNYRQEVFEDLKNLPDVRAKLVELFDKIEFNKQYGVIKKSKDEVEGLWFLMHRLNQYRDYITCVDALKDCLSDERIKSEGLKDYKKYIDEIYTDAHFHELKKDLEKLTTETSDIQSVTIGMNLNQRLEAVSMGIISVNNKQFKKSGIVGNFADSLGGDKIKEGTEWNGDMHYRQVDAAKDGSFAAIMNNYAKYTAANANPLMRNATVSSIAAGDGLANTPAQFDTILNKMLDTMSKNLRRTLDKYSDMAIGNIADVIPEFVYYIRFAEFMTGLEKKGFKLSGAKAVAKGDGVSMDVKGFYNFKLALSLKDPGELVVNDLVFDDAHTIYILTGANRGGKTTATQGVGLLFALAQGGVYVPADSFV
ncbi:MAG: DNA mismatch repair protein, partial [Clostridiales bacterium]|nr:DNA mismatch repair protein [Clostridiales bacterium]